MLLWVFRAIFAIVLLSVLIANLSSDAIAGAEDKTDFWAVLWSAGGMAVFVFLLDFFTPKKKLSARCVFWPVGRNAAQYGTCASGNYDNGIIRHRLNPTVS